jgi:DNA replication protein DnaC
MDFGEKILRGLNKTPMAPGDCVGADGLIYCGKCGEPKQSLPPADNPMLANLGPLHRACRCERELAAQEEQKKRRQEFHRRMDSLAARFGIPDPQPVTGTFAGDDSPESKVSAACRRYVENWPEMRANGIGILFYGSVGTGKTFYAGAVVNALLGRCVSAAVTSFPRLLNLLQSTPDRQKLIDHLSRYELLVIDDLGVERDSSYAAEQVYAVIDARSRSGLPLIVTTNLTPDELRSPSSMQYGRIYDRILEMCPVRLMLAGASRRAGNAKRRLEIARELLTE